MTPSVVFVHSTLTFSPAGDCRSPGEHGTTTQLPDWAQVIREGLTLGEAEGPLADRLEAYLRAQLAAEGVADECADRANLAAGPMICATGLWRALAQG